MKSRQERSDTETNLASTHGIPGEGAVAFSLTRSAMLKIYVDTTKPKFRSPCVCEYDCSSGFCWNKGETLAVNRGKYSSSLIRALKLVVGPLNGPEIIRSVQRLRKMPQGLGGGAGTELVVEEKVVLVVVDDTFVNKVLADDIVAVDDSRQERSKAHTFCVLVHPEYKFELMLPLYVTRSPIS